jgi:hypothetical protein
LDGFFSVPCYCLAPQGGTQQRLARIAKGLRSDASVLGNASRAERYIAVGDPIAGSTLNSSPL